MHQRNPPLTWSPQTIDQNHFTWRPAMRIKKMILTTMSLTSEQHVFQIYTYSTYSQKTRTFYGDVKFNYTINNIVVCKNRPFYKPSPQRVLQRTQIKNVIVMPHVINISVFLAETFPPINHILIHIYWCAG